MAGMPGRDTLIVFSSIVWPRPNRLERVVPLEEPDVDVRPGSYLPLKRMPRMPDPPPAREARLPQEH